jgi:hypothetical protein
MGEQFGLLTHTATVRNVSLSARTENDGISGLEPAIRTYSELI